MAQKDFFVDIHCHPTMRVFHNNKDGITNLWDENENALINNFIGKKIVKLSDFISKVSQSNFYHCVNGNVRVIFDSLYPVERGFINYKPIPKFLLGEKNVEAIVVNVSGINKGQYHKYKSNENYYEDLNEQYDFLINNQGPSPCGKYNYKVVRNFAELNNWLEKDPGNIAIVVTIEGAHVLNCGTNESQQLNDKQLEELLLDNVKALKKRKYPPFFMTFAHHFWNQLCGHATSLSSATRVTCDQTKGLNLGFTSVGKKVISALLSKENGKRILIDTRHMSVQSRMEYYDLIEKHNINNPADIIPTISSHTAVNGFNSFAESVKRKDNAHKTKKSTFYSWSINMCKEEITHIHRYKGLIGIILDKGRHCGKATQEKINAIKNPIKKKEAFIQLILDTIFFYVESIGEKSAWDILTLGTDFDGVINHFDCYENMSKMPVLKEDLTVYLNINKYRKDLWFDLSPEEILDKIFRLNAMNFLIKNFKDDTL
ncbi:MAG: membrane dipeptidase [Algibacter sp.]|uniref:membrane dipeptidase n=1 Tax=Algibacter sp. TaxID=1872428 RepID=UPI00260EC6D3|nr:membrane dipeptidase [Algibacter sp.]MDG2179081.1 membrane dipeptidase [Algibacter sp.]